MPKSISAASNSLLSKNIAHKVIRIYINGSPVANSYVKGYNYSMSIENGGTATVTMEQNSTTEGYDEGDWLNIKEGFSPSELFNRFTGRIFKKNPTTSDGTLVYEFICYPVTKKMSELDINLDVSAGTTSETNEDLSIDFEGGVTTYNNYFTGQISSVNANTVVYTNDDNENALSTMDGFQFLYNVTRGTVRRIISYDTGTNTITTETRSDSWANSDWITNKIYHSLFITDENPIDERTIILRSLHQPDTDWEIDYPDLSKKSVYPSTGQILFDTPICLRDFKLKVSYDWFSGTLYVEDALYSIFSANDGFGNAVVGSDYELIAYYEDIEGSGAQDTLVGAANTWYTKYNNVITDLNSAGHWSITGGSFVSYAPRTGMLTTSGGPSSVVCTTNYQFKTIQATGITIPYAYFNDRTTKSRKDAAELILSKVLTPNYKFYTLGTDHLFGNYLTQNPNGATADATLYAPKSIRHFTDSEVYTRVKLFAKKDNPESAMVDSVIVINMSGLATITDEELTYVGPYPDSDFIEFSTAYRITGLPGTDYAPTLYIDGIAASTEGAAVFGEVYITDANRYEYFFYRNGKWYFKQNKGAFAHTIVPVAAFYLSEFSPIMPVSIAFVAGEPSTIRTSLSTNGVEAIGYVKFAYIYAVDWSYDGNQVLIDKEAIDFSLFYDRHGSGEIVPLYRRVTMDYTYQKSLVTGNARNSILGDLNPYTCVIKIANGSATNLNDSVLCTIILKELSDIDEITISGGMFYPPGFNDDFYPTGYAVDQNLTVKYTDEALFAGTLYEDISATDTEIAFTDFVNYSEISASDYFYIDDEKIQVGSKSTSSNPVRTVFTGCTRGAGGTDAVPHIASPDGNVERTTVGYQAGTFTSLCTEFESFNLGSTESKTVSREVLGDEFQAAAFQIYINTAELVEYQRQSGDHIVKITAQVASISEFLVYKDSFITAQCTLSPSGTPPSVYVDTLGLYSKYGDKVFKKEFGANTFFTESELQNAAYNILGSYVANQVQASIDALWAPHIYIGQTVKVIDTVRGGDYTTGVDMFVEAISGNVSAGNGSHSIQLGRFE